MKKIIFILAISAVPAFGQIRYELAPAEQLIKWSGRHVINLSGHSGTIPITGYVLADTNQKISKAEFEVDMTRIASYDEQSRPIPELDQHLKSADFFNVDKYPKAFFSFIDMTPTPDTKVVKVRALLTIHGITNAIDFAATVEYNKENIRIRALLILDRTRWDILYQSQNIFRVLSNEIIANDMTIEADLLLTPGTKK